MITILFSLCSDWGQRFISGLAGSDPGGRSANQLRGRAGPAGGPAAGGVGGPGAPPPSRPRHTLHQSPPSGQSLRQLPAARHTAARQSGPHPPGAHNYANYPSQVRGSLGNFCLAVQLKYPLLDKFVLFRISHMLFDSQFFSSVGDPNLQNFGSPKNLILV